MKTFKPTKIAILVSMLCSASVTWAQTVPTDVGRIAVESLPGGTNTGLIIQEETPKARSSVSRAHIETLNPSSNPYQAIEMLPGVNTFSYDATGLFGGGLRVRGANSDQMGFTVNGAPVNDSGNFAVYPQEYTDLENLCEVFVTQGSTDTEAPHVGASGGNIGLVSCAPADQFRVRLSQSLGNLNYTKSFARVDTGKFANDMVKAYVSYSKSKVDKFKGQGGADKDHVDMGLEFKPSADLDISTSLLYNKAVNNNYLTLSYDNIAHFGTSYDYSTVVPQHVTPVAGTAQNDTLPSAPGTYYGFNLNPFKNLLWTGKAEYKVNKDVTVSAEPYFWWGYGTGGQEEQLLTESGALTVRGGGIADINGDGDTRDKVLVYRGSLTQTNRPGMTLKSNIHLDNQNILVGYWYERARHLQTQPAVRIDNNGNAVDIFLADAGAYVLRQDGTPYQGRNQKTISTGSSLFLQDNLSLMQDKMNVQLGARNTEIKRDFFNYANEGSGQGADYNISKNYSKLLPSVGASYKLDTERQVLFNIAQNMKAPGNFSFQNLLQGGSVVNGVLTGYTVRNPVVDMETSTNMDLGYRFAGEIWTASGSVYYINFKNRIASGYDPVSTLTTDYNVGDVITKGFELESGYKLNLRWSMYGSLSYTSSRIQSNLLYSPTQTYATSGNQMPDTPEWLSGLRIAYDDGVWFGNVDAKYSGMAYSTLMNDQSVAGYTKVDAALGYRFANTTFFKKPAIQLNVSNLFNRNYLRINSGSGSNFTLDASKTPFYYVGSPRFLSVTFRSDF